METNRKPSVEWENKEVNHEHLIWFARLDHRYQLEVHRIDRNRGELIVFDHENNDKEIFAKEVGLSYGSIFGPDMGDINTWQDMVVDFVDNKYDKD
jgi:hypothetical protein